MGKSILEQARGLEALAAKCLVNSKIDPALYSVYDVKRGLRDIDGNGVVAGIHGMRQRVGIGACGRVIAGEHHA